MTYKHLLFLTIFLLQLTPVWAMLDEEENSIIQYSKTKVAFPTDAVEVNNAEIICPLELRMYILSFLDQGNFLRGGGTSKSWRKAAEMVWKTKPLDLSKKMLNHENYKVFTQGPFSSLILKEILLSPEESGKDTLLQEGFYQLLSVQDEGYEWREQWKRLDEAPNLTEISDCAEQQVYEICRIIRTREEVRTREVEQTQVEDIGDFLFFPWFPIVLRLSPTFPVSIKNYYEYTVLEPFNLWKISKVIKK